MKFTSHNRQYEVDRFGVLFKQITGHSFMIPPIRLHMIHLNMCAELLQALRLGFVHGAHGKPVKSIMDVGYGNGAFINSAKQHIKHVYGHDVTGVPLDGAYVMPEIVKAYVITFWDVLEHFPRLDFVKDLPTETICLSLPYCHFITEGKAWFDDNYIHRKPDEHIRHFNEISLAAMMADYGWRKVAESDHEDIVRKSKHGLRIF